MHVSSTNLSYNDCFSDVDPNAISTWWLLETKKALGKRKKVVTDSL